MPGPDTEALIERLRLLHTPKLASTASYQSTVGLVVEGCQVSAIVPGGPLDKDFRGVTVQPGDVVVMVDQKTVTSETLPSTLRGSDQI
eukprot:CAMPEP_0180401892 /NCGR_PEP_ID=MMETSP0989-20121125/38546_1 /TAXON_ID=697907 /ORGANISM="non described non described, Strain CCMP2293" /LENGTH=87 /DNA_ID=CAMNT_0022404915 /DNA_START=38 /DNA_END=298 /DNA_ORIENTATION=-